MLSSRKLTLAFALSMATVTAYAQGTTAPQATAPANAQVDSRFAAWVGCWRLDDNLIASNLRVCITPAQASGVQLQTLIGTQKGTTEMVVPDNTSRPISDGDCTGSEKSEWSKDGLRVFRYTTVACGKESPRKLSSVSFLMTGPAFVQVQFVEGDQNKSVRVQRYRRAVDQTLADGTRAPQASATLAMTAPSADVRWDIDDVIEASGKLPADAVQAALTEVSGPFDLNKKTLVAMGDAKVDERVIDLMVALTYPKSLVVNRASSGYSGVSGISMGGGLYDPFMFMSPIVPMSAFYSDCYGAYGYYSRNAYCAPYYGLLGYNPYGYGGYYGGYYGNYPGNGWVIVDPSPGPPGPAQPEGRAIKGFGYTQVQPRAPEPTRINSSGGNTSSGTAGTNSGGNSNSGSSGATSGGYSGGGSSGGSDSGRVAVPRPPGGF